MDTKKSPAAAPQVKNLRMSILGGSIGNLIEYYDWLAYSTFSLYFSAIFFPRFSPTAQLLNTAAIFAVGFLMRPIGAIFLGYYADRVGRRASLVLSVSMMCAGSLLVGITPGYASIGIFAPLSLLMARLLQGFSMGGEYGISATYLAEISPRNRRGFYTSFQEVTIRLGQLVAVAVLFVLQQVLLTPSQLDSWGWRVPFVIGAALSLLAFYIQRKIDETQQFQVEKTRQPRENLLKVLFRHPRAFLLATGLTMGGTLSIYVYTNYMPKFLVNTVGLSKPESTMVSGATLILFILLQPLFGAISDRIGRKAVLIWHGLLGTLFTVPIMTALSHSPSAAVAGLWVMAGLIITTGYTSVSALAKAELFPTEVRALGVGLSFAIAIAIFGGTAEYFGLLFKEMGHENLFYWYITICTFISLICYALLPDTRVGNRNAKPDLLSQGETQSS
jgi:MHS family alpha-ketoglutarate permease-like MFS transporter